jgi:hypothetical protein
VDNSVSSKAIASAVAGRSNEAVTASIQCLDSELIGQSVKLNVLVPAVKSLAELGRCETALETVKRDFGPMLDSQRRRLQSSQLIALILILKQLERPERITDIVGIAHAHATDFFGADAEARLFLTGVIVGDDELASLPDPDAFEPGPDQVAALITDVIAEIRDLIAHHAPELPATTTAAS